MKNSLDAFNDDDNEIFDYIARLKTVERESFRTIAQLVLTQSDMLREVGEGRVRWIVYREVLS